MFAGFFSKFLWTPFFYYYLNVFYFLWLFFHLRLKLFQNSFHSIENRSSMFFFLNLFLNTNRFILYIYTHMYIMLFIIHKSLYEYLFILCVLYSFFFHVIKIYFLSINSYNFLLFKIFFFCVIYIH